MSISQQHLSFDHQPLAERMRPKNMESYMGQRHLMAENAPIGRMLQSGKITSMILWGPPGVGKTTLAELIANQIKAPFFQLSATGSGVSDVRKVLQEAETFSEGLFQAQKGRPILFIDEIHRFSKNQQDSLLSAIEKGIVTLIGATTENPSFEVIKPLLSRCQVFILKSLNREELSQLLHRAVKEDPVLKKKNIILQETKTLITYAGGDARKLLNLLETILISSKKKDITITDEKVNELVKEQPAVFDKEGEIHYDIASAMIKSIRGSDPDAALYWMARLIEGGEPPRFIARRLVISAAEDIGLANPQALVVANAAAQAVEFIGWPEGRIPLAEAVIYLAGSPKSNSAYLAIDTALEFCKKHPNLPVPIHLRNPVTTLLKELGYGDDYKYPHNYPKHYVEQEYMPREAKNTVFYTPQEVGNAERAILQYLQFIRKEEKNQDNL